MSVKFPKTLALMIIRLMIIIITTQKKKNISTAIKINLLNHISNRDTIKYACLNIEENIHKRIDIYNLSQKIS